MNKKMLVECDPHETRIALLEDDRLTELFIERFHQTDVVGNIYQGRVKRVLPGMQAAFVDIGLDRDAFLYVSDVTDPDAIKELPAEVDEEDDVDSTVGLQRDVVEPPQRSIDQLLKVGQELMVQVVKDAMANKGARLTTEITLPGRHLVFLPGAPHVGISRRIEDEEERQRLREMLDALRPPNDGLILRTAAAQSSEEELITDLAFLQRVWQKIRRHGQNVAAPTLLHRDLDLALRIVRDYFDQDFSVLWVDHEETYERIVDFVNQVQPELLDRVKLYGDEELMQRFGIDAEIESALKTKVWLKSGGHIVIHPTEALVAIDVNTGRYVGHRNLEDTVLTTNLEAVKEIVRQVRLRNLGGILVLDLIDMEEEEHRQQVFDALAEELSKDRAKNKVLSISEFGLVEITRKRTRPSLERLLTQPCPYCNGVGRIKSLTTIALELRRQILRQRRRFVDREVLLRVHPDVANSLQRHDRSILDELERDLGTRLLLQSDPELHHERFDILDM